MSLLLSERLDVLLRPDAVVWCRKNWRRQITAQDTMACEPGKTLPWSSAIETFTKILKSQPTRPAATIILSNHYVRYAVIPWEKHLSNDAEWQEFVRHQFGNTYGETVSQWCLRVSGVVTGRTRLASAPDNALLAALDAAAHESKINLHSIQPLYMRAYNDWRSAMKGDNLWFAVAEPGKVCLGRMVEGEWRRFRSQLLREALGVELLHLMEQEALIADDAVNETPIYLYAPDHGEVSFPLGNRWNLHRLPALRSGVGQLSARGINSAVATP